MNKQFYIYRDNVLNTIFSQKPFTRAINKPIRVKRTQKPYWKQRGWKKSGNKYQGYYRTMIKSFKGKAEVSPSGQTKLYIKNPPEELKKHEHWPCFMKENRGSWYFIHNNDNGNFDLSSGILQVEQILKEAFEL